jgi:hypothetical protein
MGDWYGIQSEVIESISKQGLACVIQTELEGLLSFKQTYFEPRCVMLITLDKKSQIERLQNDEYNADECEIAVSRTEQYAEYNRNHPGLFDAVIVTGKSETFFKTITGLEVKGFDCEDDLAEGYESLRNLVMTYLGLSQSQIKNDSRVQKNSEDAQRFEDTFSKDLELQRSGQLLIQM